MQARPMSSCDVCLSVTFVSCVKANKHIKIFSPSGSHAILVFPSKRHSNIPTGTPPPNGGVECRWGKQKSRFWAYNFFSMFIGFVIFMLKLYYRQCLKWKIRGEGTVRQLWASKQVVLAPDRATLIIRFEMLLRWISINGGAGTASPCVPWHFNQWL